MTNQRDWTEQNVAELSLWFRGYPGSVGSFVEGPAGTYTMTASGADIWAVNSGVRKETWRPRVKHKVQPDSATILDLKLDANAKTLISESSTGIGQRWALQ